MKIKNRKLLLACISLLLVVSIGSPSIIKLLHAVHDHVQQKCMEKDTLHLHEAEFDCDFQKFKLSSQFYPPILEYVQYSPKVRAENNYDPYFFLRKYQNFHFSLRGPPCIS